MHHRNRCLTIGVYLHLVGALLFAGGWSITLAAQTPHLRMRAYGRPDGLLGTIPRNVTKDTLGFVWVVTERGLNRLGGQSFESRSFSELGLTQTENLVCVKTGQGFLALVDRQDDPPPGPQPADYPTRLWIFNPYTWKVSSFADHYPLAPFAEAEIAYVNPTGPETFFALKSGSIYRWTEAGGFAHCYQHPETVLLAPVFREPGTEALVFGTHDGIYNVLGPRRAEKRYHLPHRMAGCLPWADGQLLLYDLLYGAQFIHGATLLLDTAGRGRYLFPDRPRFSLIGLDHRGWLWGNEDGFLECWELDERGWPHRRLFRGAFQRDDLPRLSNYLLCTEGDIWLPGANTVVLVDLAPNTFKARLHNRGISVRDLARLPDGDWLAATYRGVFRFSPEGEIRPLDSLPFLSGYGICPDTDGVWLGNHSHGLHFWAYPDFRRRRVIYVREADKRRGGSVLLPLKDSRTGKLWVAMSKGLAVLRPGADSLEVVSRPGPLERLDRAAIRHMLPSPEGWWLATDVGAFLFDPVEERILRHIRFPRRNDLVHLHREPGGNLWLVPLEGDPFYWDRTAHTYTDLSVYDPKLLNNVHAMLPDEWGGYWLPTNNGLYYRNPTTGEARNYFEGDGLPSNEFNRHASELLPDGSLLIGSINGFIQVQPRDLENAFREKRTATLLLSQVEAGGSGHWRDINPAERDADGYLRLRAWERSLRITFDAFTPWATYRGYAFRLGDEGPWEILDRGELRIDEIGYGEHTLSLRLRLDHEPEAVTKQLLLRVAYPWYRQAWFILLLVLAAAVSLRLYINWRIRRQRHIQLQLEREVAARTQKIAADKALIEQQMEDLDQLNHFKDHILGMIGHDLRRPLINYNNLARKLIFLVEEKRWEQARQVGHSVDQMAAQIDLLLRNLIQWGRSQTREQVLTLSWEPLRAMLEKAAFLLHPNLLEKNLTLVYQLEPATEVWVHRDSFQLVLLNLLNNAIKFSPVGGEIRWAFADAPAAVGKLLALSDKGTGFSAEQIQAFAEDKKLSLRKGTQGEVAYGLGLQIVRRLVRLNAMDCTLRNTAGRGGLVHLHLRAESVRQKTTIMSPIQGGLEER